MAFSRLEKREREQRKVEEVDEEKEESHQGVSSFLDIVYHIEKLEGKNSKDKCRAYLCKPFTLCTT